MWNRQRRQNSAISLNNPVSNNQSEEIEDQVSSWLNGVSIYSRSQEEIIPEETKNCPEKSKKYSFLNFAY